MRILITGRRGQVAQCLARVNDGHELLYLGRPHFDLLRPRDLREPVLNARPDIILSCAALTSVDACERDPVAAFASNAEAPGVLAEAAQTLDIPIIHLSTDYVFSGAKAAPYIESDTPDPVNIYGRSKLEGEWAVAMVRRHAVIRTTWVYSPFGGFLAAALAQAAAGEAVQAVRDQLACPTSGLDLARVLIVLAKRLTADGDPAIHGVFHGAGAAAARRAELVRAALPHAGYATASVQEMRSRDFFSCADRPLYSVLDSSKLAQVHGVRLRAWEEALVEAVQASS